jgi:hypothetical protein
MPTLAVFHLYCGENKFCINLRSKFGKMTWGSQIHKYKLVTKLLIYGPFNKEWYQVLFTRLKWSLVPPDFKECLQDIHENFSKLLKSTVCKKWTWKILKALDLQEKSFLVWRRFVTSQFCLKSLDKQSNLYTWYNTIKKWSYFFLKYHCPCWKD